MKGHREGDVMAEKDDREELENKTNAELIEEIRKNTKELERLRRSNEGVGAGGILARMRSGRRGHSEKPAEATQPPAPEKAARLRDADAARQVLAAYFMLKTLGVRFDVHGNKKTAIDLIATVASRHRQTVKTALQNIVESGAEEADLEYILPLFRDLGLSKVVKEIEKYLEK